MQARWYSCRSCTSPESINQSISPFHPVKGSLVLTCCPTCEDINGNTDPRDFCSGFLVLLTFATWSILDHRTCLLVVSLALRANLFCCEKKPKSLKTGWNLRLLSCLVVLVTVVETARQIPTQSVLLFTGSWLIFLGFFMYPEVTKVPTFSWLVGALRCCTRCCGSARLEAQLFRKI